MRHEPEPHVLLFKVSAASWRNSQVTVRTGTRRADCSYQRSPFSFEFPSVARKGLRPKAPTADRASRATTTTTKTNSFANVELKIATCFGLPSITMHHPRDTTYLVVFFTSYSTIFIAYISLRQLFVVDGISSLSNTATRKAVFFFWVFSRFAYNK